MHFSTEVVTVWKGRYLALDLHGTDISNTLELQAGLSALLEKIEEVKTGQEKLERDNNALQEYIGGLTKSMSKGDLSTGRKK